jgi:hypothetical protein
MNALAYFPQQPEKKKKSFKLKSTFGDVRKLFCSVTVGATTLSIMTLSIMTLGITAFSILILNITINKK